MSGKRIILGILGFGVIAAAGIAGAAPGVNLQEGKWETTVQMRLEGLPTTLPPMIFTDSRCLTRGDLVPRTDRNGSDCDIQHELSKADTVHWTMRCNEGASRFEGRGQVTYAGESYHGAMAATLSGEGRALQSQYQFSGRRVGACD